MEKAINTFELKGNDYEMGLKQGKTFQRQIRNFYKDLTTSDEFLASKPILFPRFLFKRLATLFSSRMIRKSIQQYFPSQWNFLKGLSKATDLSINKILFLQAIDALGAQITHYRVGEISSSLNNCSAVGITGEVSSTDGVLIVKNWDGPDFLAKCCIFRNIYPKNDNKFSTIGSGVIGLVGINNGMNEKGLSIVYNYVYLKDIGKEGIPPMIIIRGALENCSSVKEAISYFQQFPLLGGANIMVGDINGDLAILELSPKKMEVRREGFDGISSYLKIQFMMKKLLKVFKINWYINLLFCGIKTQKRY
ncbi:MAG: C45 family autoproteolytic acyltransferase/hydrolase [Candidatus Lokiarchaeota archaeon]